MKHKVVVALLAVSMVFSGVPVSVEADAEPVNQEYQLEDAKDAQTDSQSLEEGESPESGDGEDGGSSTDGSSTDQGGAVKDGSSPGLDSSGTGSGGGPDSGSSQDLDSSAAGSGADSSGGTGSGSAAEDGSGQGPDSREAGTDSGREAGNGTGTDSGREAGSGTGTDSGSEAGSPAGAETGTTTEEETKSVSAELRAEFDKASYEAGDKITVTFTLSGVTFDMAGFHITYDTAYLTDCKISMGQNLYNGSAARQTAGQAEVLATASSQQDALAGKVLATLTFRALQAGPQSLEFTAGSQLYLEGKSCVLYQGSQSLPVATRVITDMEQEKALQAYRQAAISQLKEYADPLLQQVRTQLDQAGQEQDSARQEAETLRQGKMQDALTQGKSKISDAADQAGVDSALQAAKDQLLALSQADFTVPRLEAMADKSDLTGTAADMYPEFSPEETTYYLCNNRLVEFADRTFYGKTAAGNQATINGTEVKVGNDGSFSFDVPFRSTEIVNYLVLTNPTSGLSKTYTIYSFGYGVTAYTSGYALTDSEGNNSTDQIGSWTIQGSVYRCSSYLQEVRLTFQAKLPVNTNFQAELTDPQGKVIETFQGVTGAEAKTLTFTSDVLKLEEGLNGYLLRCQGSQKGEGESQTRAGIRGYAFLVEYMDQTSTDPTQADAQLTGIRLCLDQTGDKNYVVDFQPDQEEYTLTLPPEDFDWNSNNSPVWLLVGDKEGQSVTVSYRGSTVVCPDAKRRDGGWYQVYNYSSTMLGQTDTFTVTIQVVAPDQIHTRTYTLTVTKPGKVALQVPEVYREREYIIAVSQPLRKINMVMESIAVTNDEGKKISTSVAIKKGYLTMEIADESVIQLDEDNPISGSNYVIRLQGAGRTAVLLTYTYKGQTMQETLYVDVHYGTPYLQYVISEGQALINAVEDGDRMYAEGAVQTLQQALNQAQAVYDTYASVNRYYMTNEQKAELTQAVLDVMEANEAFRQAEIGRKITAFDDLEDAVRFRQADNEDMPENLNLPDSLGATIDGQHVQITGVTWSCMPVWKTRQEEKCRYTFTAVLPAGYIAQKGVALPTIQVDRAEEAFIFTVTNSLSLAADVAVQRVPLGTTRDQLNLPNLQTYVRADLGQGLTDIPTVWIDQDGYDGNQVGTYTFQSMLDPSRTDFKVGINAKANTFRKITVIVYQPADGSGSGDGDQTGGDSGQSGGGDQKGDSSQTGDTDGKGSSNSGQEDGGGGQSTGGSGSSTEESTGQEPGGESKAPAETTQLLQAETVETETTEAGNMLSQVPDTVTETIEMALAADGAPKTTENSDAAPGLAGVSDSGSAGQTGQEEAGGSAGKSRKVYSIVAAAVQANPLAAGLILAAALLMILAGVWLGIKRRKE